jgi:hypothetical protein
MVEVRIRDLEAAIRDEATLYEGEGRTLSASQLAHEIEGEAQCRYRGGRRPRSLKWRITKIYRDRLED